MTTPAEHPVTIVDDTVIHDLLNPLTAILGNLAFLDDLLRDSAPPIVLKRIDAGVLSAEEMRTMFENLRYLMAPDARPPIPANRVDLAAILTGLKCTHEVHGPNPPITRGDEGLLRRAADAVLRAVSRIDRQPSIVIDSSTNGTVELRLTHRGRALPAEIAGRLFDPDLPRTQADHGLKIDRARGLWFARAVVEAHGGSICYHATSEGGTFIMSLPGGAP